MKKLLCLVLALTIMTVTVSAALSFPDILVDHWAYSSVEELVNDGTIGGYEDGTFRPNGIVTRAEFVKMIGKGDVAATVEYTDVPADHWAYEYVKYSGLDGITNSTFEPDTPITRGDVAKLIWKRNGQDTTAKAPSVVTDQGDAASTAWVYENGIMNGNDGVNLRLGDSLTRAEAAALIVRARNVGESTVKKEYVNTVTDDVLKTVFNSTSLIDNCEYNPDREVTNGEVAMAAARYLEGLYTPLYKEYNFAGTFDHVYSRALGYIGNKAWGGRNNTLELADKTATVDDMVSAFSYAVSARTGVTPEVYYTNGDSALTLRKFTALLIEFDHISGFNTSYVSTSENTTTKFSSVALNTDSYPTTANNFKVLLADIPNAVYEAPFENMKAPCKDQFSFYHAYSQVFTNAMEEVVSIYKNVGTDITITFYPSMVCDNGNGATMRLKVDVNSLATPGTFGTLFDVHDEFESVAVSPGMTFYADFVTGQPVAGIKLPINTMEFTDIVYIN